MPTAGDLLRYGRQRLASLGSGVLDAEVLLSHTLGVNRAWLYANSETAIGEDRVAAFKALLKRREGGEPVAYLTGTREFWSLLFEVNRHVLIPRPETELLVEAAFNFIPRDAAWRIADLGTGSGAVAVAIAFERPSCEIHATDISPQALEVARRNAQAHTPGRVAFHEGSWLEPLGGQFHLIVSNPPYVAADDHHLQQADIRFEPRTALTPGKNGMWAIEEIARQATTRLLPGGKLMFEHGYDQGDTARRLLERLGYRGIQTLEDLEHRDRVTSGSWKEA